AGAASSRCSQAIAKQAAVVVDLLSGDSGIDSGGSADSEEFAFCAGLPNQLFSCVRRRGLEPPRELPHQHLKGLFLNRTTKFSGLFAPGKLARERETLGVVGSAPRINDAVLGLVKAAHRLEVLPGQAWGWSPADSARATAASVLRGERCRRSAACIWPRHWAPPPARR